MGACASRILESSSYRGQEQGSAMLGTMEGGIHLELDIESHDLLSHGLNACF